MVQTSDIAKNHYLRFPIGKFGVALSAYSACSLVSRHRYAIFIVFYCTQNTMDPRQIVTNKEPTITGSSDKIIDTITETISV